MRNVAVCGALLLVASGACGGERKKPQEEAEGPPPEEAGQETGQGAAETETLPLGVEDPAALNYSWGKGAKAYKPVAAARKKKDWNAVRDAAEETISLDARHLDAHRVLASALAQQGDYERALEHLGTALAGDWIRWAGDVESDPDLEPLRSSPVAGALTSMLDSYRSEFVRRARGGLLVVARHSAFKPPASGSDVRVSSRAELFAYDRELARFLRLSQTGFRVIAALPSSSGDEVAYVAVHKVALGASAPPVLKQVVVGVIDFADPTAKRVEAALSGARAVALEYRAGDELVATVFKPGVGMWGLGQATSLSVDKATGKTRPSKASDSGGTRLLVRYEGVEVDRLGQVEGIAADWTPDHGTAEEFVLESSKKRVQLPRGEAARRGSVAWSPDQRRLAFATRADPCAGDAADRMSALYLVDVESGKLRHVTKARSAFLPRFVDALLLAYEDDEGAVRLYDPAAGRETGRLKAKGGAGMFGLGAQKGELCTREDSTTPVAPELVPSSGGEDEVGGAPEILEGD